VRGFIDIGSDVDWLEHGGMWARHDRNDADVWYVLRFRQESEDCYVNDFHCEVFRVDLSGWGDVSDIASFVGMDPVDLLLPENVFNLIGGIISYWGASYSGTEFSERSAVHGARLRARAARAVMGWTRKSCGI